MKKHGYWWIVKEGQNMNGLIRYEGRRERGRVFNTPRVTVESDEPNEPGHENRETWESIRYFAKET